MQSHLVNKYSNVYNALTLLNLPLNNIGPGFGGLPKVLITDKWLTKHFCNLGMSEPLHYDVIYIMITSGGYWSAW